MQSKFTRIFQAVPNLTHNRSLWGVPGQGMKMKDYYPIHKSEKLVVNSHGFDSSTLRGQALSNGKLDLVTFLLNAYPKGFVYRGLRNAEFIDPINARLHSLVGRKPLVVRDEQGNVDEALTRHNVDRHQDGDIHGISTTKSAGTALGYSSMMHRESAVVLVDTHNVPRDQLYHQIYDPNLRRFTTQGEPAHYNSETEVTISSIHISSMLGRATRSGMMTIHFEWNPLYIDKTLLPRALKEEYASLLNAFYLTTYDIRQNPDDHKITKFLALQQTFYDKLAQSPLLDPVRKERIDALLSTEGASTLENKPGI